MFEVGRTYRFTTTDHDGTGYRTATVLEVDLPLVKVSHLGNYEIINTSSPFFVSAVPNDEAAKAAQVAELARMKEALGLTGQP